MSIRNYNAFLKAARKAGGLSLPAAWKAYRVMRARVDRPLKGTDVKKHPRIFRDSVKPGIRDPKPRAKKIRSSVFVKRKTPAKRRVKRKTPAKRRVAPVDVVHGFDIESLADYERYWQGEIGKEQEEYISAVEYRKK